MCAGPLKDILEAHTSSDASDTIGRVNRLISAWPQDDNIPAQGYDSVKSIYKKLNASLKEIQDSANRDVE